ncbi:hypothetical protein PHET_04984, partial [Paragonimus heterotremus]
SLQPNQAANLDVEGLNCHWPTGVLSINNLNLQVVSVGALSSWEVYLLHLLSRMVVLMRSEVVLCILFGVYGAVLSNVNGAVLAKRHVDISDNADVAAGTVTPGENVLTETRNAGEEFPTTPSATGRVNASSEMQTQSTVDATGETTGEMPSAPALEHISPAFIGKVDLPNAVSEPSTSSGDSGHATTPVTSTTTTTGIPRLMSTLTAFSVELNRGSITGRDMASKEQVAALEELFRSRHQNTDDVDAIDKAHSHHVNVIKPVSADASPSLVRLCQPGIGNICGRVHGPIVTCNMAHLLTRQVLWTHRHPTFSRTCQALTSVFANATRFEYNVHRIGTIIGIPNFVTFTETDNRLMLLFNCKN